MQVCHIVFHTISVVESVTDATDAPNEQIYDKCNWHHLVTLFYNSSNVTTEITLVVDSISESVLAIFNFYNNQKYHYGENRVQSQLIESC